MSGGYFEYRDSSLADELFRWQLEIKYGNIGSKDSKRAAMMNPLEDREISELAYDFLCLLNSFDCYKSGNTDEEQYRKDIEAFKNRWFKMTPKERLEKLVNLSIEDFTNKIKAEYLGETLTTEED